MEGPDNAAGGAGDPAGAGAGNQPLEELLRERFGHRGFRPGQEAVLRAVLEGRSALAVFPTGGGKSICYQFPACLLGGLTLVVSPLLALMRDQVRSLEERGIGAAMLHSAVTEDEEAALFRDIADGSVRLLYLSPERFCSRGFRKRLRGVVIAMVAIDEAHCISEWGHDFRPDYLRVAAVCRCLRVRRVLALTATAPKRVIAAIRKAFRIKATDAIVLPLWRPNLDLRVTPCRLAEKDSMLIGRLSAAAGAHIVYVARRSDAERVAAVLLRAGISARAYHAGLTAACRSEAEQWFLSGRVRVMVATIAFGMGVDKPDIRGVIHYQLPKSPEGYAQETGRAGRDGLPAVCELFACDADLVPLQNLVRSGAASPESVRNLVQRLLGQGRDFSVPLHGLSVATDLRPSTLSTIFAYLENDRVLEWAGTYQSAYRLRFPGAPELCLSGRVSGERRDLSRLLAAGEWRRGWLYIRLDSSGRVAGLSRDRVARLLGDLAAGGEASVQPFSTHLRIRVLDPSRDPVELATELNLRFRRREEEDLARVARIASLPARRGCLAGFLISCFGGFAAGPCGRCDRCRGLPAFRVRPAEPRAVTDEEWERVRDLVRERHAALGTVHQLARFLCGVRSPASSHARLTDHPLFGIFRGFPHGDILAMAEAIL